MSDNPVPRDERTIAVENASYRLAYLVLSFGLLVIIAVRALVLKQAGWDLFVLLILSSGVATFYQAKQQTLTRRWAIQGILVALIAAVVGTAILVAMLQLRSLLR